MRLHEIEKPRIFYRGYNPGDKRRIKTGDDSWDSWFFVSSDIEQTKMYGSKILNIKAKPDAKILYEGTRDFIILAKGLKGLNMLKWASAVVLRAKEAGYDAVWFRMQGNIGTAIINKDKFVIDNS